jgi:hypothetical protein
MNHKQLNELTKHATAQRALAGAGIGGGLGATAGSIYGALRKKEEDESRLEAILKGLAGGGLVGAGLGATGGYLRGGETAPFIAPDLPLPDGIYNPNPAHYPYAPSAGPESLDPLELKA